MGVTKRHASDLIFPEEDENFSATLKAIRHAYDLRAIAASDEGTEIPRERELVYYLV